MDFRIKLMPYQLLKILIFFSFALSFLSLAGVFCRFYLKTSLRNLVWLFDVGSDQSIPTWYAAVTLLLCSVLLFAIGLIKVRRKDKYVRKWLILAAIFLFLSIDEVATIHEWSTHLIDVPKAKGFLYYDWVVFGAIFTLLTFLYFVGLMRRLPTEIRKLWFLSGLIFVGGALGVETLNARIGYLNDSETIFYALGTAFEELCEMLGVSIFATSLLIYLRKYIRIEVVKLSLVDASEAL